MKRLLIILLITVKCFGYDPPAGIPEPSFGIDESVDSYAGQQYTFTDGRGTIDYPISPVSDKPYTHYVDNTHPSATSSSNPYGTPTVPRTRVPEDVPAGSVIEVHGGPYSYILYGWRQTIPFSGYGTLSQPVYIRGINSPRFSIAVNVDGYYIIIEGFAARAFGIWPKGPFASVQNHHICVRYSEIYGNNGTGETGLSFGWPHGKDTHPQYQDTTLLEEVVIYNNTVYNLGKTDWDYWIGRGDPLDSYGAYIHHNAYKTWVVDNHFYDIDGDCIHLNAWGIDDDTQFPPTLSYIGRNEMHHARENALDSKVAYDTIISQNKMYNIRTEPGSNGSCLVVQTEHETPKYPLQLRSWTIFNEIYDCDIGIRVQESDDVYILGNVIYEIISSRSLTNNAYSSGSAIMGYRTHDVHIFNNVMYNNDLGVLNAGTKNYSEVHTANNITFNLTGNFYSQFGIQPYQLLIDGNSFGTPGRSTDQNNLYYQNGDDLAIKWGNTTYDSVSAFQTAVGKGTGDLESDPLFDDAPNDDFSLQASSPAINAGTSSGVVQQVFDIFENLYSIDIRNIDTAGNPRILEWDMGAYEYGTPAPSRKYMFGFYK
jgi:hypothetical protein